MSEVINNCGVTWVCSAGEMIFLFFCFSYLIFSVLRQ